MKENDQDEVDGMIEKSIENKLLVQWKILPFAA